MVHLLLAVIYLAFVSLGLPDSLLGAAWPSMYVEFGVPLSYEGILSMWKSISTTGKGSSLSLTTTSVKAAVSFSVAYSSWNAIFTSSPLFQNRS